MIASLVTGFRSKTSLRNLGFSSFTTPVCCPHSNPHGAVSETLREGELQKGSRSWESLERACGVGGRNERQAEEACARRQDSLNWRYLLNIDWHPEKSPPVAEQQLCRRVKNCSKFLQNLQWRWEVTMFLAVVVTPKSKLIRGIKIGYKLISHHPKACKLQLKNSSFSWECLLL